MYRMLSEWEFSVWKGCITWMLFVSLVVSGGIAYLVPGLTL